jgi:hypothetical protein
LPTVTAPERVSRALSPPAGYEGNRVQPGEACELFAAKMMGIFERMNKQMTTMRQMVGQTANALAGCATRDGVVATLCEIAAEPKDDETSIGTSR